ncbi:hypothetical protein [Nocardiopsis gilva]|uniref:hypothetical protein n=1 Tax=Nocardiopsis gilva TaxID=280236 RepID=UPI0003499CF5|nr:hypothetical protein [Nocardiopsis gilva]
MRRRSPVASGSSRIVGRVIDLLFLGQERVRTAGSDVELGLLFTSGPWLNWIESEFAALRYFSLNGTGHRSHGEKIAAIASSVCWRNARARPKTNFAPASPIRTWTDYPARAA